MAGQSDGNPQKTRKLPSPKASSRSATSKVKATVHLSVEANQRLTVHAAMMGVDRSSLVERLISEHLRRYVVSDRGKVEEQVVGQGRDLTLVA